MLPMAFAPRASGLIPQEWSEWRLTTPPALRYWQEMLPLAQRYWQRVAEAAQPDATFAHRGGTLLTTSARYSTAIGLRFYDATCLPHSQQHLRLRRFSPEPARYYRLIAARS